MKKMIEQLTDQFYNQLHNKEAYTTDQLSDIGFPDFLVQRLCITLNSKVGDQISELSNDWIAMQAEEVQQTKQLFLNAALNNVQLPTDKARPVIKSSIDDIVKILVQPRKNIPEVLYNNQTTLTAEELEQRVKKITVYEHFVQVLKGYINRKNRNELSKEQCKKIVANVDEKLSKDFTPHQWAQLLEPLFILTNNKVKGNLFHLFFEDKNLPKQASVFSNSDDKISRNKFIEKLSSPQKPSMANEKAEVEDHANNTKSAFNVPSPHIAAESEPNQTTTDKQKESTSKKHKKQSQNQASVNIAFNQKQQADDKSKSLNDLFAAKKTKKDKESISAETVHKQPKKNTAKPAKKPIWQQFAETNSNESKVNQKAERTENNATINTNAELLKQHLNDKEHVFIKELFNGSSTDYKKSISNIAEQKNWNQAIKVIKNNIFERNNVNVYSKTAADFIDRLQSYFDQK